MRKISRFAIVVCAAAALLMPAADSFAAQGRGRGQAKKVEKAEKADKGHKADNGSLPPGLAKREALPPGLRAQLRERGELPPGLQKRLVAVPAPLIARLPAVPPYYQRYFAGDDLIVVDTRTNRIAAIVRDVFR